MYMHIYIHVADTLFMLGYLLSCTEYMESRCLTRSLVIIWSCNKHARAVYSTCIYTFHKVNISVSSLPVFSLLRLFDLSVSARFRRPIKSSREPLALTKRR